MGGSVLPAQASTATWCVSPNPSEACAAYPPSHRSTTLTAAIAAASPGDTIRIKEGTYTDHPNVNKANLHIIGVEGRADTIFNGGGSTPITVSAGGVVIEGLTVTNGDGGIDAGSTPVTGTLTLKNVSASGNHSAGPCAISHTCYGIWIVASGNVELENVTASGNGSSTSCSGNLVDAEHSPGFDGETCFGILVTSTGGGVSLEDVTANDNGAFGGAAFCSLHETCFGVLLDEVFGTSTLHSVTANRNGASGDCRESGPGMHQGDFCFGIAADGVKDNVTMKEISASDNGAGGSCIVIGNHASDVCYGVLADGDDGSTFSFTLTDATTNHNGAHGPSGDCNGNDTCSGVIIDGVGCAPPPETGPRPPATPCSTKGNVTLSNVEAQRNGATQDCRNRDSCGGILSDPSDATGKFTLTDIEASYNGAGRDCFARDSCFGVSHDESDFSGDVTLKNIEASHNGSGRHCSGGDSCQGVGVDVGDTSGSFVLADVSTNHNGAGGDCTGPDACLGVLIDGGSFGTGNATLTDITAQFNTAGGDCKFSSSQCLGISVDGVIGHIVLKQIEASHNKAGGSCSSSQSCFGLLAEADGRGNITMTGVEVVDNGAFGTCTSPLVTDPSCYGLMADTITEVPEGPAGPGNVKLTDVESHRNSGDGVIVNASGTISLTCVDSSANGGMQLRTNKPPIKNSCSD
jgi:hypothetical protein